MPSNVLSYLNGSFFFQAAICSCHGVRSSSGGSTILFNSASAYLMSLTIGMWASLFLLISEGSMSMCTILPCLANSDTLPVTRSSNRTPKASSRSA